MELIAYTWPTPVVHEAELIAEMLQSGADRVHLRHPGVDIRPILEQIPEQWLPRVSIHDQFELANGTGIHLNGRNPQAPDGFAGVMSKSFHSVAEIEPGFDYVTLSPLFPSISKPGYGTGFAAEELEQLPPDYVVALGGVNLERIAELKRYPFKGIALLGALWQSENPIKELEKYVYRLK